MVGPLIAGIATGFAQASQRREASNARAAELLAKQQEAQKDRNLRIELSEADIINRTEINQQNIASRKEISKNELKVRTDEIKDRQKQAEERQLAIIGNEALKTIRKLAQNTSGGKVNVNTFSAKQIEGLKSIGVNPDTNGFLVFKQEREANLQEKDDNQSLKTKEALIKGFIHPDLVGKHVFERILKDKGMKITPTNIANVKSNLLIKYKKDNDLRKIVEMKKADPTAESYTDKTGNLSFYKPPKLNNPNNIPELANIGAMDAKDRSRILNNPNNSTGLLYSNLLKYETAIKNAGKDGKTELKKQLQNKAKQLLSDSYSNFKNSMAKSGNIFKIENNNGNTSIFELNDTVSENLTNLTKLFTNVDQNNTLTNNNASVPPTKSMEDKVKHVANITGLSLEQAKLKLKNGDLTVKKYDPDGLVVDSGDSRPPQTTVDPNEKPKPLITVTTVNNENQVKIEPLPDDMILTEEGPFSETQIETYTDEKGNEEVVAMFPTPKLMNTRKLDNIMYYDDAVNVFGLEYFNNKPPKQLEEYNKMKPLYPLITRTITNPEDSENYNKLASLIPAVFNLKNKDGKINSNDVNSAIELLSQKQILDKYKGKASTQIINGKVVTIRPQLQKVSLSEMNKTGSAYNKIRMKLRDIDDKQIEVRSMSERYANNTRSLGAIDLILNQIKDIEDGNSGKIAVFKTMLDELIADPNIASNTEFAKSLGATLQTISEKGYETQTDAASLGTLIVQKTQDFFKAFGLISGKLQAQLSSAKASIGTFESEFDKANDGITTSRLKETERYVAEKVKLYDSKIKTANEAAQKAKEVGNYKEVLKQQAIAHQQYLLAKNDMTKVTLTYTFAGMVQGESGGRAISNEDFAILYRALWGGAGGNTARGSFDSLNEVLRDIEIRNTIALKNVELKESVSINREMVKVSRALMKRKYAELYEESKSFSLLRESGISTETPLEQQNNNMSDKLPNIINKINGDRTSGDQGLSDESIKREGKKFNIMFANIQNKFPNRIVKEVSGQGNQIIRYGVKFEDLGPEQQKDVFKKTAKLIVSTIYKNNALNNSVFNMFKKYEFNNVNLADTLVAFKQGTYRTSPNKDKYEALLTNVISHIYNTKPIPPVKN